MCRFQRFRLVYPNGLCEEREQLVPCSRGTHSQPCTHYEVVDLGDRPALAPDSRIEPKDAEDSRPRPRGKVRSQGPVEDLTRNFKFWDLFSSNKKEKKEKKQYYFVRRIKKSKPRPTVIQSQPRIPPPHVPPVRGRSPVVVPIQPPRPPHHSPERGRRRRGRQTPVVIHQSSEEDEGESSSPPEANREHIRRTRSLSRIRYHAEKENIRLRELRQERDRQERARIEMIGREEREAQERAERTAFNLERRREREEQRERQRERDERRERREQIRQELRDLRERQRLAFEAQERRRQREEDRARLLQEQEDRRRLREADHARQERARRRQEVEDVERRRADRARRDEQARYQFAEERRYARARQANVPHHPRHRAFVHPNEDYFDRGERFDDDIRAEDLRRFERRARPYREGYDDGWLRRRHTVGGGQRGYYGQGWRERY